MNKIFFTADLHFGHTNILRHCPNRPFATESDTRLHDEWLLDLWRSTIEKKDDIYILGDLTFLKSEDARHLLEKLPGHKHMILGNHDGSIKAYSNYFVSTNQLNDIVIKPAKAEFLHENLQLSLCHYPMVTWNHKPHGSIMLHGHCHGRLDEYNGQSPDLRFDVGIDGQLSQQVGATNGTQLGFIPLEVIYEAAIAKAGGTDFKSYATQNYKSDVK